MLTSSFHNPEETFDFLFRGKEKIFPTSGRLQSCAERGVNSTTISGEVCEMEAIEDDGIDGEGKLVYFWCSECNAEFLTREELKIHSRTHEEWQSFNKFGKNDSLILTEEFKLMSSDINLLRSRLCCVKCKKEFKNEKRLVKHIKKYDFNCKPKSFEGLNNLLKDLKPSGSEATNLCGSGSADVGQEIVSQILEDEGSLCNDSFVDGKEDNGCMDVGIGGVLENILEFCGNSNVGQSGSFGELNSSNVSAKVSVDADINPLVVYSAEEVSSNSGLAVINDDTVTEDLTTLMNIDNSTPEICNTGVVGSHQKEKSIVQNDSVYQDETVFTCDYCIKPHKLKSELREHIVMFHLSPVGPKCSICYRVFSEENELCIHYSLHLSKSKYICSVCDENFSSRGKLIVHINGSHNTKRGCTCSVCYSGFPSRALLGLHHLYHSSDKKYKCSKCSRGFFTSKSYDRHIRSCYGKTLSHKCDICGKEFTFKGDLTVHSFIHENKKFPCHLCPKIFTRSSPLYVHIRNVHFKLKPHECGICQRKFGDRMHLVKHYAIHSDDRPFKCEDCGKDFKWKWALCRHMRNVHGK